MKYLDPGSGRKDLILAIRHGAGAYIGVLSQKPKNGIIRLAILFSAGRKVSIFPV